MISRSKKLAIVCHTLSPFLPTVVHTLCAGDYVVNASCIQETALRDIVMLTFKDLPEATDRLGQRNITSIHTGKLYCYEERLRQESLYLSCTADNQLVLLRQLIHAEDCDDILHSLYF